MLFGEETFNKRNAEKKEEEKIRKLSFCILYSEETNKVVYSCVPD